MANHLKFITLFKTKCLLTLKFNLKKIDNHIYCC